MQIFRNNWKGGLVSISHAIQQKWRRKNERMYFGVNVLHQLKSVVLVQYIKQSAVKRFPGEL